MVPFLLFKMSVMQIATGIIDYLLKSGGVLQKDETWHDVGLMFSIEAPDSERASRDKIYEKRAISRKAQEVWTTYIRDKNDLRLTGQTFKDGELFIEKFSSRPKEEDFNREDFDLERVTTNPHGGAWLKYKKKSEVSEESLKDIFNELNFEKWSLKPFSKGKSDLFVLISDTHLGAKTSNGEEFTLEVYKERLREVVQRVSEEQREPYRKLVLVHLGDWMDGVFNNNDSTSNYTTRGGHAMPSSMSPREAFKAAYETQLEFLEALHDEVEHESMEVIMLTNSNHDSDTAFAASTCCEIHLKHTAPQIKYDTITDFIHLYPLSEKVNLMFSHGKDREYLKRPLPRILNDKTENYLMGYCMDRSVDPRSLICFSGDQHNWSDVISQNIRYIKCPSLFGSSEHAEMNYGRSIIGFVTASFEVDGDGRKGVTIKPEII